jgi:hypothetical protein
VLDWPGSTSFIIRLFKKENKMEFNKIDLAKMFDVTVAIDNMEKSITSMITYLPEQVRDSAHTVSKAQFGLARTTAKGMTEYAQTVEKVAKESVSTFTKSVEKATKVAA